jgi:uncharacterized membrane protein
MLEYFASKTSNTSLYVALLAIMTALTTVATAVLVVPFPSTQGYFNLGDSLVMISGLLLGPVGGFFAGGVGSAMADVVLGFPGFAPITFIAKGFEGLVVGLLSFRTSRKRNISGWDMLGLLLGSVVMLLGYLLGEMFILGYPFEVAALELITINSIQVIMGSIATILVGPLLRVYLRDILYEPPLESPSEPEPEETSEL